VKERISFVGNLLLCATVFSGCVGSGDYSRQVSSIQAGAPIFDRLIVPGVRVGPIAIGMTSADLLRHVGEPSRTDRLLDGNTYHFGGIRAFVGKSTLKVHNISVTDSDYATREGLRVGSSELAVKANRGAPDRVQGNEQVEWWHCYRDGIVFVFPRHESKVEFIRVWVPGCYD
jgi:hypothetical protein